MIGRKSIVVSITKDNKEYKYYFKEESRVMMVGGGFMLISPSWIQTRYSAEGNMLLIDVYKDGIHIAQEPAINFRGKTLQIERHETIPIIYILKIVD